jgi:hypothetical protein
MTKLLVLYSFAKVSYYDSDKGQIMLFRNNLLLTIPGNAEGYFLAVLLYCYYRTAQRMAPVFAMVPVNSLFSREPGLPFLKHGRQCLHMILRVVAEGLEGCGFFHDVRKG